MRRSELEKYLGKTVRVTLFDRATFNGVLHKTGEEAFKYDPNLYLPKKHYVLISENLTGGVSWLFRCSHVTKIEEVHA